MTEITFRSDMTVQLIQHMGGDDMITLQAFNKHGRVAP